MKRSLFTPGPDEKIPIHTLPKLWTAYTLEGIRVCTKWITVLSLKLIAILYFVYYTEYGWGKQKM
jgi:hypothetical protein